MLSLRRTLKVEEMGRSAVVRVKTLVGEKKLFASEDEATATAETLMAVLSAIKKLKD